MESKKDFGFAEKFINYFEENLKGDFDELVDIIDEILEDVNNQSNDIEIALPFLKSNVPDKTHRGRNYKTSSNVSGDSNLLMSDHRSKIQFGWKKKESSKRPKSSPVHNINIFDPKTAVSESESKVEDHLAVTTSSYTLPSEPEKISVITGSTSNMPVNVSPSINPNLQQQHQFQMSSVVYPLYPHHQWYSYTPIGQHHYNSYQQIDYQPVPPTMPIDQSYMYSSQYVSSYAYNGYYMQ